MNRGDRLIYRFKPRGGYGFTLAIPVKVVRLGRRRRVLVEARSGHEETRRLWVREDRLSGLPAEDEAAHA